jgi:hypothetical protein
MISSDVQLGVTIGLGVLFVLSFSSVMGVKEIGGSATLPQFLIALAALVFWGVSLWYMEEGAPELMDYSTFITALLLAVAFSYHFLYGRDAPGTIKLVMGVGFLLLFYGGMRYTQNKVMGRGGTEAPTRFTIAQPGAEECPGKSIDELTSDKDWVKFVNGTKRQQREILGRFERKFHPVNCRTCQGVCTDTFYYATTFLK